MKYTSQIFKFSFHSDVKWKNFILYTNFFTTVESSLARLWYDYQVACKLMFLYLRNKRYHNDDIYNRSHNEFRNFTLIRPNSAHHSTYFYYLHVLVHYCGFVHSKEKTDVKSARQYIRLTIDEWQWSLLSVWDWSLCCHFISTM